MKNSNDTTGNRTRDLPACNSVLQPTALRRAVNSNADTGHAHCIYTVKHCYVIALAQMSGAIQAKIFSNLLRHLICHYQMFFSTYLSNLIQRSETRYVSKYGAYKYVENLS